jgi:hypothetical protein
VRAPVRENVMATHPEPVHLDHVANSDPQPNYEQEEKAYQARKRIVRSNLSNDVALSFKRLGYYQWDILGNPGRHEVETTGFFAERNDPHEGFTDPVCTGNEQQPYIPYFSFIDKVEVTSPGIVMSATSIDGAYKLYFQGDHIESQQRIYLRAGQRCIGPINQSSGRYFARSIAKITRRENEHICLHCHSLFQASSTIPATFNSSIHVFNDTSGRLLGSFPMTDTSTFYTVLTERFSEYEVIPGQTFRVEINQEMIGLTESLKAKHFGSSIYLTLSHEVEREPT